MRTFDLKITSKYNGYSDNQFHWTITLKRDERSYVGKYSAGEAHCKKVKVRPIRGAYEPDFGGGAVPTAPTLESYLACLQSDARAGEYLLFEDFCSDFGYSDDSRNAESIWRACQRVRGEMQRLLGSDFTTFMSQEFDV